MFKKFNTWYDSLYDFWQLVLLLGWMGIVNLLTLFVPGFVAPCIASFMLLVIIAIGISRIWR